MSKRKSQSLQVPKNKYIKWSSLSEKDQKKIMLNIVCKFAPIFTENFVNKEYLIYSDSFNNQEFYIITNTNKNYMHITGLSSPYGAEEFYNKCIDNSFKLNEIDFYKSKSNNIPNPMISQFKVDSLKDLEKIFSGKKDVYAQEDFLSGKVSCILAATEKSITIGISKGNRIQTLLKGDRLSLGKQVHKVSLILERKKGDLIFSRINMNKGCNLNELPHNIKSLMDKNLFIAKSRK